MSFRFLGMSGNCHLVYFFCQNPFLSGLFLFKMRNHNGTPLHFRGVDNLRKIIENAILDAQDLTTFGALT